MQPMSRLYNLVSFRGASAKRKQALLAHWHPPYLRSLPNGIFHFTTDVGALSASNGPKLPAGSRYVKCVSLFFSSGYKVIAVYYTTRTDMLYVSASSENNKNEGWSLVTDEGTHRRRHHGMFTSSVMGRPGLHRRGRFKRNGRHREESYSFLR